MKQDQDWHDQLAELSKKMHLSDFPLMEAIDNEIQGLCDTEK